MTFRFNRHFKTALTFQLLEFTKVENGRDTTVVQVFGLFTSLGRMLAVLRVKCLRQITLTSRIRYLVRVRLWNEVAVVLYTIVLFYYFYFFLIWKKLYLYHCIREIDYGQNSVNYEWCVSNVWKLRYVLVKCMNLNFFTLILKHW